MAVTVHGAGAFFDSTGAATCVLPAVSADDIIVIFHTCRVSDTPVAPTGYVDMAGSPLSVASGVGFMSVWWKRAGASESDPTIPDPGSRNIGAAVTFSGVPSGISDPFDFIDLASGAGSGTSVSAGGGGSTSGDGAMVVTFVADEVDSAAARFSSWANASLASITEQLDGGGVSGTGNGIGVATGIKTTAGAVSATTVTDALTAADSWGWIQFALKAVESTRTADLAKTLAAAAISAAASHPVTASLSATLAGLSRSAAAVVATGAAFSKTLGPLSLSADGTVFRTGNLSLTLTPVAISAAAAVANPGVVSKTLGALAISAAATDPIVGTLSKTFAPVTISAAGTLATAGAASLTLGALTPTAAGSVANSGAVSKTLSALGISAASHAAADLFLGRKNRVPNSTGEGAGTFPDGWVGITRGLTISKTGAGTDFFGRYVEITVSGSPSGSTDVRLITTYDGNAVPAAVGQDWAAFMGVRAIGAVTNIATVGAMIMETETATAAGLDANSQTTVSGATLAGGAYHALSVSRTLTQGATAFVMFDVAITPTSLGVSTSLVIRLYGIQLEPGSTQTLYQPTAPSWALVAPFAAVTLSAAGTVSDNLAALTATLAPVGFSAAATVASAAALTQTLGAAAISSTAFSSSTGVLSKTLAPLSPSAAGSVGNTGALDKALGAATLSGAATHPVTARLRGTNLMVNSERPDLGSWSGVGTYGTITPQAAPGPDGRLSAFKLVVNDGVGWGAGGISQLVVKPAESMRMTFEFKAKAAEYNRALCYLHGQSSSTTIAYIYVNLDTGATISTGIVGLTNVTFGVTNAGDGFWRITVTATTDAWSAVYGRCYASLASGGSGFGDGVSGIYITECQINYGDPTAYEYQGPVNGYGLDPVSPSIAAAADVDADLSETLAAATGAGAGVVATGGILSKALGTLTLSGAGTISTGGALSKTLGALTASSDGDVFSNASASITLGGLGLSAAATHPVVAYLRGRNLLAQSEHDTGWAAFGVTPPVADGAAVEDGYDCVATTFDASMTSTGYAGCRANGSTGIARNGPFLSRALIKLSRPLVGSEGITVYVTGSVGIGGVSLNSGNSPTTFTEFIRTATLAYPLPTMTEYFVAYLSGVVASPVTVYLAERQIENNASFTGYEATFGVSGANLDSATLSAAVGVDVVADLSVSFDAVTLSASGTGLDVIIADLDQTFAPLALSAAATAPIDGVLSKSLAAAVVSAAASADVAGALSRTLGTLAISAAGGLVVAADLSKTLGAVAVSAAATNPIVASAAVSLAPLILSGDGSVGNTAALTQTLAPVALAGAAVVPVAADLSKALAPVSGVLTASDPVAAALSASLAALQGAGAGVVGTGAVVGLTLASLVPTASGAVLGVAELAETLGPLTLSGAAAVATPANLTLTLDPATVSAAAVAVAAASVIATLEALSFASTAENPIVASAGITLGALTLVSEGSVDLQGALSVTLAALDRSISGAVANPAELSAALDPAAILASSSAAVLAELLGLLDPASISAEGVIVNGAVADVGLAALQVSSAGALAVAADLNETFGALVLSADASLPVVGSLSVEIGPVAVVAVAGVVVVADLAALLEAAEIAAAGGPVVRGDLVSTFGPMSGAASGKVWPFRRMFFSLN